MAASVLQQVQTDNAGGASSIGQAITCTLGSSLHIIVTLGSSGDIHPSAPIANTGTPITFALLDNVDDAANSQRVAHWKADNVPAQTTTITVTFDGVVTFRALAIKEIGGTSGYDAVASAAHAGQLQATPTTGTDATTSGNTSTLSAQPALVSGFCMNTASAATTAVGTGFTNDKAGSWWQLGTGVNLAQSESKRVTATTALAATFTSSDNVSHISLAAVFLETAGGGTVNTQTLSDTLTIADAGFPSAVRGRVLGDSVLLSEGPTVFSTVYGLLFGDDLTVTDQQFASAIRSRVATDTAAVVDEAVQFYRRTRLAESSLLLSDEAIAQMIGGLILTRVLTSQLDVNDASIASIVRTVIASEFVTVTDSMISSIVGQNILNAVLTSTIDVTDGAILSVIRARLLQDTIILSEGSTDQYTTTNLLADDELAVTDSSLTRLLLTRLLGDSIDLSDAAIAAIVGQNVIEKVLSDNIDTADEAIRWMNRVRFGESLVLTADEVIKVMRLTRELTDAIDLFDGTATAMQRFILLTDTLSVDDGVIASFIPDTGPVTHNPIIRIGFDQPRIEIGGRALI